MHSSQTPGVVDPGLLYDPPFTDAAPTGPDGIFTAGEVDALFAAIESVRANALPAEAAS